MEFSNQAQQPKFCIKKIVLYVVTFLIFNVLIATSNGYGPTKH